MANTQHTDKDAQIQNVDYDFWGRMPGWTTSEAAALLLGIDPDRIPTGDKNGFEAKEYQQLCRILARAEEMDLLSSPMPPREFVQWAISNRIPPNERLKTSLASGKKLSNWRKRYFKIRRQRDELAEQLDDSVSPKERTALLTLILGMARAKFDHKAGNRHTVSMIETALQTHQLSLNKDTIKKYLDEADERLAD